MQTRRLALPVAAALAALAALLLAGCAGPAEPEWTPPPASPEPSASAAATMTPPSSEDEAWAGATGVVDGYLGVQEQLYFDRGEGVERLAPFVTERHLEKWRGTAEQIAADSFDYSGELIVVFDAQQSEYGAIEVGGELTDFSLYRVRGCQDGTALIAEGQPEAPRFPVEYRVIFDADRGWLVDETLGLPFDQWESLC